VGIVRAEFTISLDGYIAGPNDDISQIFGWYNGGDVDFALPETDMVFHLSQASADVLREEWSNLGALVTGRRDFDVSEAWGGQPPFLVPMFIVTHHPPPEWADHHLFRFVTAGVTSAVAQAQAVAGDRVVGIGGSTITRQCLRAGLLDELSLHVVPILLGDGIHLFSELGSPPIELAIMKVVDAPGVTHLKYRVVK
jgi:dihydrofolate reductase